MQSDNRQTTLEEKLEKLLKRCRDMSSGLPTDKLAADNCLQVLADLAETPPEHDANLSLCPGYPG